MERGFTLFPRLKERAAKAGTLRGRRAANAGDGPSSYRGHGFCLDEPSLGLAPLVVRYLSGDR
jgi:ABC-type branched-subunit amino acid transport system ATPase component